MFSIRQLRYAVSAADTRSFRRVATTFGTEASVVSRRIKELEAALGIDLFVRSKSGVSPTPEGAAFLQRARRILSEAAGIYADVRRPFAPRAEILRVGTCLSLRLQPVAVALTSLRAEMPELELAVTEGAPDVLVPAFIRNQIDVLITTTAMADGRLIAEWTEPVAVLLPPNHRLTDQNAIPVDELAGERLLISRNDSSDLMKECLLRKVDQHHRLPVLVQNDVSPDAVAALVRSGFGLGLTVGSATEDRLSVSLLARGSPVQVVVRVYASHSATRSCISLFGSVLQPPLAAQPLFSEV